MAAVNWCKCTIPFIQNSYGWTENYSLANPSSTLNAELALLIQLAAKRILLSGGQTRIEYLKVSNEAILRDAQVKYLGPVGGGAMVGSPLSDSEPPDTALLCARKSGTNQQTAPLYMRGIWDILTTTGGGFDVTNPTWNGYFNSFVGYLTSNAFGMICKDPASPPRSAVTAVTQLPSGQIEVVVQDNIFSGPFNTTKFKSFVSGVLGAASVNGQQIMIASAANTCFTVKPIPMFDYTSGGFLTANVPQFFLIGGLFTRRIVERKAGRPLYLSRGRQRGRKLA